MRLPLALAKWLWHQNWMPLRYKKTVYKTLSHAGKAPDTPFEMDFFGLTYRGNLRNGIEFAIFFYGAFEKPLLYFMRDVLHSLDRRDTVACDIGANVGQHSLFLSLHAQQVHAFEPFSRVAERLAGHLHDNQIANIVLHPIGLGDENAQLPFYAPSGSNQGTGSFADEATSRGNRPLGNLQVRRGDDYFAEQGINTVDLIKIDVEGFERPALLGLQQTLRRNRPILIVEVSYGEALSFRSRQDLLDTLPPDYELLTFDTRKPDGRTARRRGARAKRSGAYRLIPHTTWRDRDQDDLVAVPKELMGQIPRRNLAGM